MLIQELNDSIFPVVRKKFYLDTDQQVIFHPTALGEIIIVREGEVSLRTVGQTASTILRKKQVLFQLPRIKGSEITAHVPSKLLILSVNPFLLINLLKKLNQIKVVSYIYNCPSNKNEESLVLSWINEGIELASEYENNVLFNGIKEILCSQGRIQINQLYQFLGTSKATLEHYFSRNLGITPKMYCRIAKFDSFMDACRSSPGLTLTELSHRCGYYDQSHLIKDFKFYLERTPKKYFATVQDKKRGALSSPVRMDVAV